MTTLFDPFTSRALCLSNRIVMAPMTRNHSKGHIPGDDVAQYYRRRAEAGVGLIITEGTVVGHKAAHGYPDVPSFYGSAPLEGWRHVVEEVHAAGGKIFPQLWHVGSVRQSHQCTTTGVDTSKKECCCETNVPGYGPSPVAHPAIPGADVPHEMTHQDIQEVIDAFAKAALEAKNLGFDGVEIHGAHGYLIDQFFWEYTNKRTDQYGGKSAAERTHFAVQVIKAVRKSVGPTFPIDFRFSQWKMGAYEAKLVQTPQELEAFLKPLVEAGVDLFHCSTRRFWEPEFAGSPLNLAGWTKKITGKPTITVGSIGLDVDFINSMQKQTVCPTASTHWNRLLQGLYDQEFDLIAIGRALLADPLWPKKVRENRMQELTAFSQEALKKLY